MTRQEFLQKWGPVLAGIIAVGTAKARVLIVGLEEHSPAKEVLAMLEQTSERILGKLYEDLVKTSPLTNGVHKDALLKGN